MKDNNNTEPDWRFVAQQLRQPNGAFAEEIGQRMNVSNEQIHHFTFDVLDIQSGMEVLEIGMGNGHYIGELFKRYPGIHYTGIDYSSEMVEQAKQTNQLFCQQQVAHFLHCNIDELPATEALYDRIFTINTLYFWERPDSTLRNLRRLLKPGGKLSIAIRPKHIMEHHPFTPFGFTLYSREDLCQLLEKNSFDVVSILEKTELASAGISDNALPFESLIITAQ
jgi:ubiquinone/menaquinone biosynthesis C-methylase UbiE